MNEDFVVSPPDPHRETTGERLVRIETLMQGLLRALNEHIRGQEKELQVMKDAIKGHLADTAGLGGDVRQLSVDVKDMKDKVTSLEKEVRILSESKSKVIAWAAGVSATVSALWIVAGPKLASIFNGS